jgi:hypothetical protein
MSRWASGFPSELGPDTAWVSFAKTSSNFVGAVWVRGAATASQA